MSETPDIRPEWRCSAGGTHWYWDENDEPSSTCVKCRLNVEGVVSGHITKIKGRSEVLGISFEEAEDRLFTTFFEEIDEYRSDK